jgi:hypothetical protein
METKIFPSSTARARTHARTHPGLKTLHSKISKSKENLNARLGRIFCILAIFRKKNSHLDLKKF